MNAHDRLLSPPLERCDGAARVAYALKNGRSGLETLYQKAPCRVLFPDGEAGDSPTAVLVTTSGGLTGGDKLDIKVEVGAGAQTTITTQAAEKIYRSTGPNCSVRVSLKAASDAWLEWLMQETILFDGAKLARRTEADIAPTARLLAVESLVFGRSAMGEDFRYGRVHDVWRVRRGDRLIWLDALKLDGDVAGERRKPFALGDSAGCATILYVGADAAQHLDAARAALAETQASGGATSFDGILLLRLLAPDAVALRNGVMHIVSTLRSAIAGLPPRLPRVWSI